MLNLTSNAWLAQFSFALYAGNTSQLTQLITCNPTNIAMQHNDAEIIDRAKRLAWHVLKHNLLPTEFKNPSLLLKYIYTNDSSLKNILQNEYNISICPICLDITACENKGCPSGNKEQQCKILFCESCLSESLKTTQSCPHCRASTKYQQNWSEYIQWPAHQPNNQDGNDNRAVPDNLRYPPWL